MGRAKKERKNRLKHFKLIPQTIRIDILVYFKAKATKRKRRNNRRRSLIGF